MGQEKTPRKERREGREAKTFLEETPFFSLSFSQWEEKEEEEDGRKGRSDGKKKMNEIRRRREGGRG